MAASGGGGREESVASGKSTYEEDTSFSLSCKQLPLKKSKRKQLPQEVEALISSATVAAHSFLSQNDLLLSPSQILSIESLLAAPSLFSLSPLLPPSQSSSWFHRFISSASSEYDPRWLHCFRMSKPSFSLLLSLISPSLLALLPSSVPPNFALAAALFRLAHAAPYKSVARRFGLVSSDQACRVFFSVCKAVIEKLGNLAELRSDVGRILVGFGWISLPNCCGVLGFGRFGVDCPELGRNGSLLVQALVDSEGRFLDISAGWPSTMRTETILHQTKLYLGVQESEELFNGPPYKLRDGSLIPQYILGDSCFPLLPWLLTPYARQDEEDSFSSMESEFNIVHGRAMGLVGTAFGRVRARWQLLAKRWTDKCVEIFPFVIVTGCLLHNFLIRCSEPLPEGNGWYPRDEELPAFEGEVDDTGRRIRDVLAQHLSGVRASS
ncbi:protein ANTAGONIST OF LIKE HETEROCHROMATIN PROTEIN 1 [Tripterygium wilfordii]|uniref:protein ANTAGONIST OF LIKE HETEROCHROMATIN PROTEIN 1 n=1 Tax=Tripterygium wilfordii TaxID=458696 RepID=UPI0018F84744|nr:protein ANTAGONIST OF LIKE HETEROCHROMATIN PROTEIN 1 [Tripterygium wilfordii]